MNKKRVLLTGVTGFLGSHTAIQLLNKGYDVVGTLRNKDRADSIREVIAKNTKNISNLTFVEADIVDDNLWFELAKNIDYIQHIASPFPKDMPKDENELILPAKQGTLNILKAASANNVKRVVLVSSVGAIIYGKTKSELNNIFNEDDWTDITNLKDTTAYFRSKTIAEKIAWDFIKQDKSNLELTTVCPGAILGPVIDGDFGTSANIIISLLNGSLPALPKIEFDVVDVRSVADLLIKAMEIPQAAGNRYIAVSEDLSYKKIAKILKEEYPNREIPLSELPIFATKFLSIFKPILRPILLRTVKRKTNISKAVKELQWQPLSAKEAIISCAKSIFENGILK